MKDIKDHVLQDCPNRNSVCRHCGKVGTFWSTLNVHEPVCAKVAIPCVNSKCSAAVLSGELTDHVSECKYAVVSCRYKDVGCTVEMERGKMAAHEGDDAVHLHMALCTVVTLQDTVEKLTMKLEDLEGVLHTPRTLVLRGYQRKKESDEIFSSSPTYASLGGYYVVVRVHANGCGYGKGTHASVFASLMRGKHDGSLKWPFVGKFRFTMLNQLEDDNHYTRTMEICVEDNMQVGSSWGFSKFTRHTALSRNMVKNIQYLKDDSLYFRVSVEVSDTPWLNCT
jgi:TNF receptor-associated factor 4